jgi:D-aspartate ligase
VKTDKPFACVLGDMDLVRPLGLAGIECVVAVPPGAASRFSRFTRKSLRWSSPWENAERLVETLVRFGKSQPEQPVLFYESDAELLMVSRHREQLRQCFRFAIADQTLVEDLVDKERFQKLAERLSLPVPRALRLHPEESREAPELDLRYPIIVKPLTRRPETWKAIVKSGKALRIENPDELQRLWPRLAGAAVTLLAQELIPGPEMCVVSYHVYVDAHGKILGEFTGRKIRTYPLEYGDSTALVTTDETDVAALGRELVQRLGLQGVAKFDFKRAPEGKLSLLEVNPRYNLWHHLGALAGVNIPALVFSDLVGTPGPVAARALPGVSWCRMWQDALAARKLEQPLARWLSWAWRCEAKRLLAWDDPMPFVGAVLWRLMDWFRSRLARRNLPFFQRVRPAVEGAQAV